MNENTLNAAGLDMSQVPLVCHGYSKGLDALQNIASNHDLLSCINASAYAVSILLVTILLITMARDLKNNI